MPSFAAAPEGFRSWYADLHIHLGWAGEPGGAVKISAGRDLTLEGILRECRERKGISVIGVIDAATCGALRDLEALRDRGLVTELAGGGLSYQGDVTLLPGAEVEVAHPENHRAVHLLCYLPGIRELRELARWQEGRVRNRHLSSQRHHDTTAADVVALVGGLGGVVVPAHLFTPFKAALAAADRLAVVIPQTLWEYVPAVELGLSSDTDLGDRLPELSRFSFLTNSDAHSLGKIAREYNLLHLKSPTFAEVVMALRHQEGRRIAGNFGLEPRLGKYHRTFCLTCDRQLSGEPPVLLCPQGAAHRLVLGVLDRIVRQAAMQEGEARVRRERPPYVHQVPLQFVPGLGKKGLRRLLDAFGTEMAVLHHATEAELAQVVGQRLARLVILARAGELAIEAGGGGTYGRVLGET